MVRSGLNSEPQNNESSKADCKYRTVLNLFKIDRSTQKLTTDRIHYFDIRHSLFDIRFIINFADQGLFFDLNLEPWTLNPEP